MITRELLTKFLEDRCTPEELTLLKKYFLNGDISDLNQILEEDWNEESGGISGQESDYYRERILDRLRSRLYPGQVVLPVARGRERPVWKWMAAAVVVFCMLAWGGFMLWKKPGGIREYTVGGVAMVEQENNLDVPVTLSLSDGSTVVLEPGSVLRYPGKFRAGERLVHLRGKAFFDVSRDTLNPFLVNTRSLNVRVLGTSFNISSFDDSPAEVSVVSGKVAVFLAEEKGSLILEPNERAVRLSEKAELTKMLVEEPVLVRPEVLHSLFDFDEVPVSEVFEALESAYDIRIVYDPIALKHCTLKAYLEDQPLFTKLKMICVSMGLEYEVSGMDIVIKGPGC